MYRDTDDNYDADVAGGLSNNSNLPSKINGARQSNTKTSEVISKLQNELIEKIGQFRSLRERDEVVNDPTSSSTKPSKGNAAPQKIDFYSISKEVGDKSQEIVQLCNEIAKYNPTFNPTKYLGNWESGDAAPLNGAWRSLFTTAADANFPKRPGQQSAPKVQNVKGTITNVVDSPKKEDGSDPTFQQLNVVIKATPVSPNRVELQFKYAKAVLTKLLWFKFKWALFIPVPPPIVVRCIVAANRFVKSLGKKKKTRDEKRGLPPNGYFDVLYLDHNLRVHKTGEDNYFVQARQDWEPAQGLLGA
ncbi:MAG: hypothetical protein SGARI_005195 [Bacillariaceae sp.]